jgi:UDP-glucose 4-epimerase
MLARADKIVVTGGAGFIGSHLVDRLLEEVPAKVLVFDNLSSGRLSNLSQCRPERIEFVHGDVRDAPALEEVLRGASVVYHLAAQRVTAGSRDTCDRGFATNVVGTFNVLRAATRQTVRRVVFASSRDAYGEPMELPVDESHPLLAISCYGASKIAGEAFCRAFRREFGLQTVILRLSDVYGPRDWRQPIPAWLDLAAAGRNLDVYDGKQIVDLLWVGQAVEALIRAATIEETLPPINVASGTGTKILDVARRITHLTEGRSHVNLLPAPPTQYRAEVSRFVAKVDRMRQLLHIEPPLDPLVHLPALFQRARAEANGAADHASAYVSR